MAERGRRPADQRRGGRPGLGAVAHGVRIAAVAHAGDGNLHPLFVFDRGQGGAPA